MSLNDIVTVTITSQTRTPTRVGFGIPAVLGYHNVFPERYRSYTDATDMITDGFVSTHPVYLAASAILAQNPKPTEIIVGRAANDGKKKVNLIPVVQSPANGIEYAVYINGHEATYTTPSEGTPTVATIIDGLKIAIDALSLHVVTTDNTTSLDIEATAVSDVFSHYVNDRKFFIQKDITPNTGGAGIVEDIVALRNANDDWYCLVLANNGKAVIEAAAVYIETQIKMMAVCSPDDGIYTTGVSDDVASDLHTATYARTMIFHHPKASTQCLHAAVVGQTLPQDPGSLTWKFKTVAGVDGIEYTSTEIGVLEAKYCNYYSPIAGVNITQQGVTSAAEFIDVTHFLDFIRARLQEYIYAKMINTPKIAFTDPGIAIIENEIRSVLQLGIDNGGFAADPAPDVSVPKAADVASTDKGLRHLPSVTWTATLAGAIHSLTVAGTVSV